MNERIQRKKNGEIELLRFISAMLILLFHAGNMGYIAWFPRGNLGVEFFFIVTGYLLAGSAMREPQGISWVDINRDSYRFLCRKIKSFYPELAISCAVGIIVIGTMNNQIDICQLCKITINTIGNQIFLLNNTGLISGKGVNDLAWYLSAMILVCAIIYPMLRRWGISSVLFPIALICLGGMYVNDGIEHGFGYVKHWAGFMYKSNFRAFAEISIGVCLFPVIAKIKSMSLSRFSCFIISVAKFVSLCMIVAFAHHPKEGYDGIILIAIVVLIALAFSEKGIASQWHGHRICLFLGKLSLPLYLSHAFYSVDTLNAILPAHHPLCSLIIMVACSFATALFIMALGKWVRAAIPKLLLCDGKSK